MPKTETKFACQECGYISPRWFGKCPECSGWNTFVEEISSSASIKHSKSSTSSSSPVKLSEITATHDQRIKTGIIELDRVLGGGIVAGCAVLVGGEPGIGKSTLMLQLAASLSGSAKKVLYVTGEESPKQLKIRAHRLKADSDNIFILSETDVASIESNITTLKPDFVIIDSIQTLSMEEISSAPGSVSQVRECAFALIRIAKSSNIPIFIIGHVTKEGLVAGPRILEHMVDTVLYFEGEKFREYRILRATKNRFGSVNEVGLFEMKDSGLEQVQNPSKIFLDEISAAISGSAICVTLQGSRPIIIEIQALVSKTNLAIPRRLATGIDYNRLLLVSAVLERRANIHLSQYDIHLSVAGGIKVFEPAADLAIAAAIVSCLKDKPIDIKTAIVGELGLGGEIRSINQLDRRIAEIERLGFNKIIVPKENSRKIKSQELKVVEVSNIKDAILSAGL